MSKGNLNLLQAKVINNYKEFVFDVLRHSYPDLSPKELDDAINYSIFKRCKNSDVVLENNYKDVKINSTALDMAEYILSREPIITPTGVMFKKQGDVDNPLGKMVDGFLDARNVHKKEMFKYPKGSEMFIKFNLLQLLDKIDCNAIYGCIGAYSSIYYNLFVSPTITGLGRSLISTAGMFFEGFLGCNVKFRSLDDMIYFIRNVEKEKPNRKFRDCDILDEDITVRECAYKLLTNCGFEFIFCDKDRPDGRTIRGIEFIPTQEDVDIILDILYDLDQETINRLYYKNNLYTFMDNKTVENAIIYLLSTLEQPMLDANHAPDEIKVELDEFCEILKEYVYYTGTWIDKEQRYRGMTRIVNALTDTDSCIASFDAVYHCVVDKIKNIDMKIMHESIDIITYVDNDEFGDPKSLQDAIDFDDDDLDFDFFNDEIIHMRKTIDPLILIPQEGVRYSVINIFAYCVTKLVNDYMVIYTQQANSYSPDKDCRIYMKNEFLFKSILLNVMARKNYATLQEVQEGNIVPKEKQLDIKGMPLNKSSLQDSTRDRLKKIMYEDVLNSPQLDQVGIIKKIAIFEKQIYENIRSGKKDYYKPLRIKAFDSYPDPMRQMGVKAAIVYNSICDANMDKLDLTQRNSIDVLKVDIDLKKIERIKDSDPERYNKVIDVLNQPEFKGKITAVGFPKDSIVPDWILEFADYNTLINNNVKNFPMDLIGVYRGNDNNNYSNIVKL